MMPFFSVIIIDFTHNCADQLSVVVVVMVARLQSVTLFYFLILTTGVITHVIYGFILRLF